MIPKKLLKALSILLIIFSLWGISGCLAANKSSSPEQAKKAALDFLNTNYDDNFTAKGYNSGGWAYNYDSVYFISEKYGAQVEVRISNRNGKTVYKDDYYKLYMVKDAENFFLDIASECGISATAEVRFTSPINSDALNAGDTFYEYMKTGCCNLYLYILTDDNLSRERYNTFVSKIAENRVQGHFKAYLTKNFDKINNMSVTEFVKEHPEKISGDYNCYIDENYKIEQR